MSNNKKDPITEENLLHNLEYNSANRKQEIKDFIISKANDSDFFKKICKEGAYANLYNRHIWNKDVANDPKLCIDSIDNFKKLDKINTSVSNTDRTAEDKRNGDSKNDSKDDSKDDLKKVDNFQSDSKGESNKVDNFQSDSKYDSKAEEKYQEKAVPTADSSPAEIKEYINYMIQRITNGQVTRSNIELLLELMPMFKNIDNDILEPLKIKMENFRKGYCGSYNDDCKKQNAACEKNKHFCSDAGPPAGAGGKKKSRKARKAKKAKKSKKSRKTRKSKKAKKTAKK